MKQSSFYIPIIHLSDNRNDSANRDKANMFSIDSWVSVSLSACSIASESECIGTTGSRRATSSLSARRKLAAVFASSATEDRKKRKGGREGREAERGSDGRRVALLVCRVGGPITLRFRAHEQHVQAPVIRLFPSKLRLSRC